MFTFCIFRIYLAEQSGFSMHYSGEKKEEERVISTKYAAFKLFNKTSFVNP
jgi:hypothetical protein